MRRTDSEGAATRTESQSLPKHGNSLFSGRAGAVHSNPDGRIDGCLDEEVYSGIGQRMNDVESGGVVDP